METLHADRDPSRVNGTFYTHILVPTIVTCVYVLLLDNMLLARQIIDINQINVHICLQTFNCVLVCYLHYLLWILLCTVFAQIRSIYLLYNVVLYLIL
jgi:hypothetical protein